MPESVRPVRKAVQVTGRPDRFDVGQLLHKQPWTDVGVKGAPVHGRHHADYLVDLGRLKPARHRLAGRAPLGRRFGGREPESAGL